MPELPRRTVLIGAAVGPLAACSTSTEKLTTPATPPVPGQALASTADIPVNSGKVVGDTLITQPQPGVFDAFVAHCTHAGCLLSVGAAGPATSDSGAAGPATSDSGAAGPATSDSGAAGPATSNSVESDTIDCPCHGSRFALNGTVVRGPAMEPLVPVKIAVKDGLIVAM